MKRKIFTLIVLLFSAVQITVAQSMIRGRVTNENGDGLADATVIVQGTSRGSFTDNGGNFVVAAKEGDILEITATSFKRVTVPAANGMVVKMVSDKKQLNEVVATSYGLKKEKRTLGYANTTIDNKVINQGQNINALQALSGKVAGINVTSSSGTPGASSFIQLRGVTSFEGNTQPLIVVDGTIIDGSASSFGEPDESTNVLLSNISGGSRLSDINPEDIENVSIIKGPAGAALYGSQGANGVILITTKKGSRGGVGVSYNAAVTWDNVNKMPALQNTYLQGRGGNLFVPTDITDVFHRRESWGPKGDTMAWDGSSDYLWDKNGRLVSKNDPSAKKPFTPYDNVGKFFTTGMNTQHNVAISAGGDRYGTRFSIGNVNQTGVINNSLFNRITISNNSDFRISDKFTASTLVNYSNTKGRFVQQGSNLSGIMLGLLRTPVNFDNSNGLNDWRDPNAYLFPFGVQRTYRGFGIYDNPYYTINENLFNDNTNRVFGNITLNYQLLPWLGIMNRTSTDMYTTIGQQNFGMLSSELAGVASGRVAITNESFKKNLNDLFITITPRLPYQKLGLDIILGNNISSENSRVDYTRGDNFLVDGWYNLNNTTTIINRPVANVKVRNTAQFVNAKLAYNKYLFLDVTGRLEQSSLFMPASRGNNFYPSANMAFIFSDAFDLGIKELSYGKLRLSWGKAGINPTAQSTRTTYGQSTVADGWTSGWSSPINGVPSFDVGILYDPNLRPEITRSAEIGTELRFFNNRLGLDYTFYNNRSKDLLLALDVARTSGYGAYYTNSGVITNRGHEVLVTGQPVAKKNFRWDVSVNYARNRNVVEKIANGIPTYILNGFEGSQVVAKEGLPFGVFYGIGYLRDDNGNVLIQDDPAAPDYGFPQVGSTQMSFGSVLPKWIGGLNNQLTYKGVSLNFLFETRQGGIMWNGTRGALCSFGMAKETEGRGKTEKVFDGVMGHIGADGKVYHYNASGAEVPGPGGANTKSVILGESYWRTGMGSGFNVNEPFVEDASWTRLRELGVSYAIPSNIMGRTKYVKGLSFGVVGRNLFLWTKYKGVDPETSLIGGGKAQGMDYFNNPGIRSFGVNLRANF